MASATAKVWDPLVRVFHWSLVASFAVAWLTADEVQSLHEWAGYAAAALIGFRLLYGLVGPRYARFSQFVRGPKTTVDYAADVRAPTPTGAAELAVPVKADLQATIVSLHARLSHCVVRHFDKRRQALRSAARALPSPDQLLALPRRRFDEAASRLSRGLTAGTERRRARLNAARLTPATLMLRIADTRKRAERDGLRSFQALARRLAACRQAFSRLSARVRPDALQRRNTMLRTSVINLERRLDLAEGARLERLCNRLAQAHRMLATLRTSHESILERGYALAAIARDLDIPAVKPAQLRALMAHMLA